MNRIGSAQRLQQLGRQVLLARSHLLYCLPCDAARPSAAERPDEQILTLTCSTVDANATLRQALLALNPDTEAYLDDIAKGRMLGVVMLHQSEVVHYSFLYLQNRTHCLLGLPQSAALIGNAFTVKHYRGRGAQARSILVRAALAAAEGFSAVYAETHPDNHASQRGMTRAGMHLVGRMDLLILIRFLVVRWRHPPGFRPLAWCR